MIEISLKSSDLLYLSASLFEVPNASATVVILPGLFEHKERYYELISTLNNANFNAIIADTRGHGKSINGTNPLGYIDSFEKLIKDTKIVLEYTYNRYPLLPIYAIGDSLGALMALGHLKENVPTIQKLILLSPLVNKGNIDFNLKSANLLMKFSGTKKSNSLLSGYIGINKDAIYLKDMAALESYNNDSLCTFSYANISIISILNLQKYINDVKFQSINANLKILILSGALDNISAKERIKELTNDLVKLGFSQTQSLEYSNMGHKIIFEPGKVVIYHDILNFLNS